MTSYSITSSDMNLHEHTHTYKQAGRWWSSESVRHEDTQKHTPTNPSPLTHQHTESCAIHAYNPHHLSRSLCTIPHTLIALDIFSFSRRHILHSSLADANIILGHPSYSALMFCSSLTFWLLGRRFIWACRPCACGERF